MSDTLMSASRARRSRPRVRSRTCTHAFHTHARTHARNTNRLPDDATDLERDLKQVEQRVHAQRAGGLVRVILRLPELRLVQPQVVERHEPLHAFPARAGVTQAIRKARKPQAHQIIESASWSDACPGFFGGLRNDSCVPRGHTRTPKQRTHYPR